MLKYEFVWAPFIFGIGLVWAMEQSTIMPSMFFWVVIALFQIGFILFAFSKLSLMRTGYIHSFGSSQMSKTNRITYFLGYGAVSIGFFLLIGFAIAPS